MRLIPFTAAVFLLAVSTASAAFSQIVPANTAVMIRLNQAVSSQDAKRNQRVKASVADDVTVKGDVLIPKGAPAAVFVAQVQPGGDSSKPAVLMLRPDAVTVGGRAYPVTASYAGGKSTPIGTAKNPAVSGPVGTSVKAKASGQKSAASGGAAAGSADPDVITPKGVAEVSYPADAVLSFRLAAPLYLK